MINRFSIGLHFCLGAAFVSAIVATNPMLAQRFAIGFDRLILNLIELLYQVKNLG